MARIWLAAILGILLGVTLAYTTGASVASPAGTTLPMVPFQAQLRTTQAGPVRSDSPLIFVSLLAGIVVAAPAFFVAKKRA